MPVTLCQMNDPIFRRPPNCLEHMCGQNLYVSGKRQLSVLRHVLRGGCPDLVSSLRASELHFQEAAWIDLRKLKIHSCLLWTAWMWDYERWCPLPLHLPPQPHPSNRTPLDPRWRCRLHPVGVVWKCRLLAGLPQCGTGLNGGAPQAPHRAAKRPRNNKQNPLHLSLGLIVGGTHPLVGAHMFKRPLSVTFFFNGSLGGELGGERRN